MPLPRLRYCRHQQNRSTLNVVPPQGGDRGTPQACCRRRHPRLMRCESIRMMSASTPARMGCDPPDSARGSIANDKTKPVGATIWAMPATTSAKNGSSNACSVSSVEAWRCCLCGEKQVNAQRGSARRRAHRPQPGLLERLPPGRNRNRLEHVKRSTSRLRPSPRSFETLPLSGDLAAWLDITGSTKLTGQVGWRVVDEVGP